MLMYIYISFVFLWYLNSVNPNVVHFLIKPEVYHLVNIFISAYEIHY